MKNNKHVKFLTLIIGLFLFCALIQGSFSMYRELSGDSSDLSVLDPNTNYAIIFIVQIFYYFYNWYDVICGFKSRSEADGDEQVKYSYGVKSRASIVRELL